MSTQQGVLCLLEGYLSASVRPLSSPSFWAVMDELFRGEAVVELGGKVLRGS